MVPAACIRLWVVSPMTKQIDAESIEGKASPRLVLTYRYLGLGPCQTAGECATRSWVRRVVQPPHMIPKRIGNTCHYYHIHRFRTPLTSLIRIRTEHKGLVLFPLRKWRLPVEQNRRMKKMTCNEGTTHISCTGLGATLSVCRWNVTKGSPVHRMMGTRTACSHG